MDAIVLGIGLVSTLAILGWGVSIFRYAASPEYRAKIALKERLGG